MQFLQTHAEMSCFERAAFKAPSLCAHDEENGFVDPAREPRRCVSVQHIKQNI